MALVASGPYAYVRHPGYLAGIVIILASGLALGSWLAALLVIASSLPFLLYRAISEDRVLQTELPGYADYARRVRWGARHLVRRSRDLPRPARSSHQGDSHKRYYGT